ncbi:MAG: FAD-dependent oxidoreductase [Clostridia bacterium]|nr:FAD-dependent oxidoreductase [Clostridia bacterium]
MFDTAIIGTGPAGLSAALTLKMRGKDIIWFGSPQYSGKIEKSEKIGNYPGLGMISGPELNERFRAHAEALGLKATDKMVTSVSKLKEHFMILADNEVFEARTVLLSTGVISAKPFPGEEKLLGRGVSYCATCDGMFYRGKTIAVFCGAKRYEHEVDYLAEIAKKVYLLPAYRDCNAKGENIEMITSPIKEIKGENRIQTILLGNGTELSVDGFFCLRGAIAPTSLMPGLMLEGPHIVTDRQMATNIPGCFAAGDCTGAPYQIAKSVGEGNVAAHSILEALAEINEKK